MIKIQNVSSKILKVLEENVERMVFRNLNYMCVGMSVCVCCTHAMVCGGQMTTFRSRILSLLYVGSEDWTQILRTGNKHLYLLNHLTR